MFLKDSGSTGRFRFIGGIGVPATSACQRCFFQALEYHRVMRIHWRSRYTSSIGLSAMFFECFRAASRASNSLAEVAHEQHRLVSDGFERCGTPLRAPNSSAELVFQQHRPVSDVFSSFGVPSRDANSLAALVYEQHRPVSDVFEGFRAPLGVSNSLAELVFQQHRPVSHVFFKLWGTIA